MGLFDFINNKKGVFLSSPVKGKCISIKEVADPTFSGEVLGKGIAIQPSDGKIYAPADGTISTMFPTGHAVGITTSEGIEILIHVGLDTVELRGEFFHSVVKDNQVVHKGELLLEANLDEISKAGYDTVTIMVICNSTEFTKIDCKTKGYVNAGDNVITCIR